MNFVIDFSTKTVACLVDGHWRLSLLSVWWSKSGLFSASFVLTFPPVATPQKHEHTRKWALVLSRLGRCIVVCKQSFSTFSFVSPSPAVMTAVFAIILLALDANLNQIGSVAPGRQCSVLQQVTRIFVSRENLSAF